MKRDIILYIAPLLIFLGSCGIHRPSKCFKYIDTVTVTAIDTVVKHTSDTIITPGDTVAIHDTIKVDCINGKPLFKGGVVKKKKGNANLEASIDSLGVINISASCDSLVRIIDSLQVNINKNTTNNVVMTEAVEHEKNAKERWRFSFFAISGVFFAFLMAQRLFNIRI